jgi:hypothetical protein
MIFIIKPRSDEIPTGVLFGLSLAIRTDKAFGPEGSGARLE